MLMDMIDVAWQKQITQIRRQLHSETQTRTVRRELQYEEQPDVWQARGHASGGRRPSLSELDGDE